jgi:hypothetical protein
MLLYQKTSRIGMETMQSTNGKTSQDVGHTGTYTSECCDLEMVFEKDATFQRCPKCKRLTSWELVELQPGKAA